MHAKCALSKFVRESKCIRASKDMLGPVTVATLFGRHLCYRLRSSCTVQESVLVVVRTAPLLLSGGRHLHYVAVTHTS